MRVKNLHEFLFEQEQNEEKLKLVILTKRKKSDTAEVLKEAAEKKGFEVFIGDVDKLSLVESNDGYALKNRESAMEFPIDRENTVILSRRGVIANTHTRNLLHNLEKHNFFCVNSLASMEICENKFLTTQALESVGLPVPKTALIPSEEAIEDAVKAVGGKFPVIVKLLAGTQGIGVSIIDSLSSLKSVYQTFKKLDSGSEVLVQEKIDSDADIRIQVLTKKFNPAKPDESNATIIGAMQRNVIKGDFRTNYSLGGSVEKIELTPELEEVAMAAASVVGCNWCGVDIILDKKNGNPYILEINSSPGTKGMISVNGETFINDVIDYLSEKSNWSYPKLEIGFREIITIPKLGDMVAKFDTGNGSKACSMHADNIETKDSFLHWEINGKKFKSKIVNVSSTEVGEKIEERPYVHLDIEFAGKTIKDVAVAPVDRTPKSTPFLANRKFMERLGIIVNPDKAFVITTFDGDYDALDSKGKKHAGIIFNED